MILELNLNMVLDKICWLTIDGRKLRLLDLYLVGKHHLFELTFAPSIWRVKLNLLVRQGATFDAHFALWWSCDEVLIVEMRLLTLVQLRGSIFLGHLFGIKLVSRRFDIKYRIFRSRCIRNSTGLDLDISLHFVHALLRLENTKLRFDWIIKRGWLLRALDLKSLAMSGGSSSCECSLCKHII
jgi:hypothetical protein